MSKLKPCPFCGSKKVKNQQDIDKQISWNMCHHSSYCVICLDCGSRGTKYYGTGFHNDTNAEKAWNKRAELNKPRTKNQ